MEGMPRKPTEEASEARQGKARKRTPAGEGRAARISQGKFQLAVEVPTTGKINTRIELPKIEASEARSMLHVL